MKHPLSFIPYNTRRKIFLLLLAWTLFLLAISQIINSPLINSTAASGIISFELAHTPARVQAMIASWDAQRQLLAVFGLGFDFLFIPSYAFTIALACLLVMSRNKGWFTFLGMWLGWGVFLASLLDVIENIGLLESLLGNVSSIWSKVSFLCASFKFALILLGLVYGMIGWIQPIKKT